MKEEGTYGDERRIESEGIEINFMYPRKTCFQHATPMCKHLLSFFDMYTMSIASCIRLRNKRGSTSRYSLDKGGGDKL